MAAENQVEIADLIIRVDKAVESIDLIAKHLANLDKKADDSAKKMKGAGTVVAGVWEGIGNRIGGIIADIPSKLKKAFDDVLSHADKLNALSVRLQVSREWLQKTGEAAARANVDLSTVARSANMLSRNISQGKDAFAKYGIEISKLRGLKPEQQFDVVVKAIQKIPDANRQAAASMELLRDRGGQMLQYIRSDIENAKKQAEEFGLVMNEATAKGAAELSEKLGTLRRVSEGLWRNFVSGIANSKLLHVAVEKLTEIIGNLSKWVQDNQKTIMQWVAGGIDLALASIQHLVSFGFTFQRWLEEANIIVLESTGALEKWGHAIEFAAKTVAQPWKFKENLQTYKDQVGAADAATKSFTDKAKDNIKQINATQAAWNKTMDETRQASYNLALQQQVTKVETQGVADATENYKEQLEQAKNSAAAFNQVLQAQFALEKARGGGDPRDIESRQKRELLNEEHRQKLAQLTLQIKIAEKEKGKEAADLLREQYSAEVKSHALRVETLNVEDERLKKIQEIERIQRDQTGVMQAIRDEQDLSKIYDYKLDAVKRIEKETERQLQILDRQYEIERAILEAKIAAAAPGSPERMQMEADLKAMDQHYQKQRQIVVASSEQQKKQEKINEETRKWGGYLSAANELFSQLGIGAETVAGQMLQIANSMFAARQAGQDFKKAMDENNSVGMARAGVQGVGAIWNATSRAQGQSRARAVLGGAMTGASVGSAFGPWGAAAGAVAGGIVGLFRSDPVRKAQQQVGRELGHAVSREMAQEMMDRARETGKTLQEVAQEFRREEKAKNERESAERRRTGAQQAFTALSGLFTAEGEFKIRGQAETQGRLFSSVFWKSVADVGLVAAVDSFRETFDKIKEKMPEDVIAPIKRLFDLIGEEGGGSAFRDAFEGADALAKALAGVASAGYLTRDMFKDFQTSAQAAYDQAIGAGATEQEALLAIGPLLANVKRLHEEMGIPIDDNTQKLLDQAEASGMAFPVDPLLEMLDVLREIAKALGAELPEAARRGAAAMEDFGGSIPEPPRSGRMDEGEFGSYPPDYTAAAGFGPKKLESDTLILAHAGEHVLVVPKGKKFSKRKALRGIFNEDPEGDIGPGPVTGGGASPVEPEPVAGPGGLTAQDIQDAVATAVAEALKQVPSQVNVQYTVAPAINENPLKNAVDREQQRRFTIDSVATEIRSREGALVQAIREVV